MTDKRASKPPADAAAEYALGLLSGDERRAARRRALSDPQFAREVARWNGRLAPLADEIEPIAPPETSWTRIERALGAPAGDSNVIALRRRVTLWRGFSGAMTALAAALALVLLLRPDAIGPLTPTPTQRPSVAAPPMVAMLGNERKQMKLVASWDPSGRQLVLAVAGDMPSDAAHSHELWVIPASGSPHSLGTMPDARQMHVRLAEALAELMREGATIAVSVEPRGGSPTGAPTGPVVASGALAAA